MGITRPFNGEFREKRAESMLDFLLEGGHNISDLCEDFGLSARTCRRDFEYFLSSSYDQNVLIKRKVKYYLAMRRVRDENSKRRKKE